LWLLYPGWEWRGRERRIALFNINLVRRESRHLVFTAAQVDINIEAGRHDGRLDWSRDEPVLLCLHIVKSWSWCWCWSWCWSWHYLISVLPYTAVVVMLLYFMVVVRPTVRTPPVSTKISGTVVSSEATVASVPGFRLGKGHT